MIQNLSQLKQYFKNGGAIKMIYHAMGDCKTIGVIRKAIKVQTNAVKLEDGSWLEYPKASLIEFVKNGFSVYSNYDWTLQKFTPDKKTVLMSYTFEK